MHVRVRLVGADWAARLGAQTDHLVESWSQPDAWDGTAHVGGPMELPAVAVGGMVLGELVVHGWDLALATGQDPHWEHEVLELTYDLVAKTAEQGREMGVYGPEVAVPGSASRLDRLLGLTGRHPRWTP